MNVQAAGWAAAGIAAGALALNAGVQYRAWQADREERVRAQARLELIVEQHTEQLRQQNQLLVDLRAWAAHGESRHPPRE